MKLLLTVILITQDYCQCVSPQFQPAEFYTQLIEQVKNVAEYYKITEEPVSVTYDEEFLAQDAANTFISQIAPSPVFIVTEPMNTSNPLQPRNIFYFVSDVEMIYQRVKELQWDALQWSVRGPLHFIVCTIVQNRKWLKPTAEMVWKNHLLDFLIVFYYKKVEALEYNPFFKRFRRVDPLKDKKIFSNKLQNMNGYPLRVSMFNDPPRILNIDGVLYGTEARQLYEFARYLNASLIIRLAEGNDTDTYFKFYYDDAIQHRSDFGMVTCFAFEANTALKYSYPRRMDDVVAVVPIPKRLPQYQYIFLVFNVRLWIGILIAGAGVSLLKFLFDRFCYKRVTSDLFNSFLEGFSVIVCQPVDSLVKGNSAVMTLFIWWCYAAMVLNVAFQCSLTSIIITPKYEKDIRTIQDLKERSCDMYINKWHRGNAGQDRALNACMTTETEANIIEKMMNGNTDHAFATQLSVAETIVSQKIYNNLPIYHIVEEHLVPGYGVYLFPTRTPYNEAENRFLLWDEQFGITRFNSTRFSGVFSTQQHSAAENVALSLDHLQTPFFILIIGSIVSIVAFVLEKALDSRLKKLR